jgi:hypothetical protein
VDILIELGEIIFYKRGGYKTEYALNFISAMLSLERNMRMEELLKIVKIVLFHLAASFYVEPWEENPFLGF